MKNSLFQRIPTQQLLQDVRNAEDISVKEIHQSSVSDVAVEKGSDKVTILSGFFHLVVKESCQQTRPIVHNIFT